MSNKKIFRFHQGADVLDWGVTSPYGEQEINGIADPEGASATRQITSIPSTFARIDLVRSAFKQVAHDATPLHGYTIHHRLVSEALDVAEIFFNQDALNNSIKFRVWDKTTDLQGLLNSANPKHKLLGETLALYLNQDAEAYNFGQMERLYLLEHQYKIIGGTSPSTLFFSSANDLSFVNIRLGNHRLFSEEYLPLHQREPEFQKLFYYLFKVQPALKSQMKEVYDYLTKSLNALAKENAALYHQIQNLQLADYETQTEEADTGKAGEQMEVLGTTLRKKKIDAGLIGRVSDFAIRSDKFSGEKRPLVLQRHFSKPLAYTSSQDAWDKGIEDVPYYYAETELGKRVLPARSVAYPHLVISDFLEPYLIRTVFPIQKNKYFDGNLHVEVGNADKGYLLPLKPTFFEYFSTDELRGNVPNTSKPMFEMTQLAGATVRVTLRVPIQKAGEFITFERLYSESAEYEITPTNEAHNKGIIIENQFSLTVFPFVKTQFTDIENYYRVQLLDREYVGLFANNRYRLAFFSNNGSTVKIENQRKRQEKEAGNARQEVSSEYYQLNNCFDFLQVQHQYASGLVIPLWHTPKATNEQYAFAIDFGTTNTHIEYKVGEKGTPRAFDIPEAESQIATLFDPARTRADFAGTGATELLSLLPHEFVPFQIGKGQAYKFPQRTVMAQRQDTDFNATTVALADLNIPFTYEKDVKRSIITPNLKWGKQDTATEKRIKAFFEELMMLLRNKVLMNGGDLKQTRVVWFYPSSMKAGRINSLQGIVNEVFERYFGKNCKPLVLTESLAPFYYYTSTRTNGEQVMAGSRPVVSIDIGGGTSDVVVFNSSRLGFEQSTKPYLATSFRFAANALLGDGFGKVAQNGLIDKYLSFFDDLLARNAPAKLRGVLAEIKAENRSEDINAFLFSLEQNSEIKDPRGLSYNAMLQKDEDFKIVFLYFYAALIYHVAQMMRSFGIAQPIYVTFSGTGSKLLGIVSASEASLSAFTQFIFEKVYAKPYTDEALRVVREQEFPKEVTCKGGLMAEVEDLRKFSESRDAQLENLPHKMKEISHVFSGVLDSQGNALLDNLRYDQLNDDVYASVQKAVQDFNAFFLGLNQSFNFNEKLNISGASIDVFSKNLNRKLEDYLFAGLRFSQQLDEQKTPDRALEETLFFYPIVGVINEISLQLAKISPPRV